jgi:hypothetical protein
LLTPLRNAPINSPQENAKGENMARGSGSCLYGFGAAGGNFPFT